MKQKSIIIEIWDKIFSLNVTIKIFFIIIHKVFLIFCLWHSFISMVNEQRKEGSFGVVENEDFNLIKMSSFGEISSIHTIKLINRTKPALKCSFCHFLSIIILPFPLALIQSDIFHSRFPRRHSNESSRRSDGKICAMNNVEKWDEAVKKENLTPKLFYFG